MQCVIDVSSVLLLMVCFDFEASNAVGNVLFVGLDS
jgi:hypothetical protein